MSLTPRVGIDLGYALASDADVTVLQLAQSEEGQIGLDPVQGIRAYVETVFRFALDGGSETAGLGQESFFEIALRGLCLEGFSADDMVCGYGGSRRFVTSVPSGASGLVISLDYEEADDLQSTRIELLHELQIMEGNGSLRTQIGASRNGDAAFSSLLDLKL